MGNCCRKEPIQKSNLYKAGNELHSDRSETDVQDFEKLADALYGSDRRVHNARLRFGKEGKFYLLCGQTGLGAFGLVTRLFFIGANPASTAAGIWRLGPCWVFFLVLTFFFVSMCGVDEEVKSKNSQEVNPNPCQ